MCPGPERCAGASWVDIHRADAELPAPATSALGRLDAVRLCHRLDKVRDDACEAGLIMVATVGPFGDMAGLSQTARSALLDPRPVGDGCAPASALGRHRGDRSVVPAVDADLDIIAIDAARCTLSINH